MLGILSEAWDLIESEYCYPFREHPRILNEELAYLIELKFGEFIEPEDRIIKKYLKSRGLDIVSFIDGCGRRYVEKAFVGICAILKVIDAPLSSPKLC